MYKQNNMSTMISDGKPFLPVNVEVVDNKISSGWVDDINNFPGGSGLLLDCGAGAGKAKERLEKLGYKWIGLDTRKYEGPLSIIADGNRLPFINESFNVVYFRQVLQYLPEPEKALSEIWSVLKKDSYLYGSVSFLEPFDNSFFGLSHWGIEKILSDAGFKLETLIPGESVFLIVMRYLVDRTGTNWAPLFTRIISIPLLFALKMTETYFLIRFGKRSDEYNKFKKFIYKIPLRFAGRIIFIAKKLK